MLGESITCKITTLCKNDCGEAYRDIQRHFSAAKIPKCNTRMALFEEVDSRKAIKSSLSLRRHVSSLREGSEAFLPIKQFLEPTRFSQSRPLP